MSSITWTASALASELAPLARTAWRVVESQNKSSTRRLTDTAADQDRLETLLEASKPPYPPGCERLDYLLKTPFRYHPPRPHGSRFRRPHEGSGVFYAAEAARTALAETAFYRLLFFARSASAILPQRPVEHTLFSCRVKTDRALDLTAPPLLTDRGLWTRLADYAPCQALAAEARAADTAIIRYTSVRDAEAGANLALLTPAAFARRAPDRRQTWNSLIKTTEVVCYRAAGPEQLVFPRAMFAADPRLTAEPA